MLAKRSDGGENELAGEASTERRVTETTAAFVVAQLFLCCESFQARLALENVAAGRHGRIFSQNKEFMDCGRIFLAK